MRKFFTFILLFSLCTMAIKPQEARAEMPVKARAFMTIVGYGAGGGALLGAASMAFGTSTRAVAQGASLGLYAGILFGTYVLVSHHNKRYGQYDDNSSPYQESSDIYGEGYNSEDGGSSDGGSGSNFFERIRTLEEKFHNEAFSLKTEKRRGSHIPPLHINLIHYNF